jgi:arylsulfatase A-like enzyme
MALLLALGPAACTTPEPAPATSPEPTPVEAALTPNILLFDIDSMRSDRLDQDSRRSVAPTLHALADRGVVFEAAYTPSGWTAPALAALLVGRFPPMEPSLAGHTKVWSPTTTGVPTLPEVLGYYGYQTAAFWGGTTWGVLSKSNQGFDHSTKWSPEVAGSQHSDVTAWLEQQARPPFFAMVHNVDLHRPLPRIGTSPSQAQVDALPPCLVRDLGKAAQYLSSRESAEEGAHSMARRYDCGLKHYDTSVARILAALEASGFAETTIVVITSNHGELLLEHGMVGHELLYEPILHIPLVIFDPRNPQPHRVAGLVTLQDLAPTLLTMAGAVVPREMQGRSLLPLLEQSGTIPPLDELYALTNMGNAAIRSGQHKLIRGDDSLTEGRTKYTWSGRPREGEWSELFDLQADPDELVDLTHELPELAAELEARLTAWQTELYVPSDLPLGPMDAALEAALKEGGYWDAVVAPEGDP